MRQLFVFPPSVHVGAVTCGPPPRQDAAQRHRGNVVVCVEPRADSPTRHNIPLVMNRVIFGTFYSSLSISHVVFFLSFFSTFAAFIYSHRRLSAPENLNITKFFLVFLLLLDFQLVHGDDDNLNARVTRPCDCTVGLAAASSAMREREREISMYIYVAARPFYFFSMKFCYLPRCVFSLTPAAPIPGNLQILF
jgi:hypothetical protein